MSAVHHARSPDVLWRRVGDEVLIASLERPEVDRLSVAASAVWLLLERPLPQAELTEALAVEFAVGEGEISGHVDRMVGELEARGWLMRTIIDG